MKTIGFVFSKIHYHAFAFWLKIGYSGQPFTLLEGGGVNVKIEYSDPQKVHSLRKTRLLTKFCDDASDGATCGREEETKKDKETYCGKLA